MLLDFYSMHMGVGRWSGLRHIPGGKIRFGIPRLTQAFFLKIIPQHSNCRVAVKKHIGDPFGFVWSRPGAGAFFLKTGRPPSLNFFRTGHAAGRPASRPWKFPAKFRRASRAKPDQNGTIAAETCETESSRAEPDATHALCLSKTLVFTSRYAFLHLLRTHCFIALI